MPPLLPPDHDLRKKAQSGDLVLFIGAGMSQSAGLPGWEGLLETGLEYAQKQSLRLGDRAKEVRRLIKKGELLRAAEELKTGLGPRDFADFLYKLCVNEQVIPTPAHRMLQDVRCAAILTTNFDTLIEMALPPGTLVCTHRQSTEFNRIQKRESFGVVKVHGTVTHAETIVLGQADYREEMYGKPAFREFFETIAKSRTLLFLGCSLTDPDFLRYLDQLNYRLDGQLGPHYALMKTKDVPPSDLADFSKRYGIRILGADDRDGHPDIAGLLHELIGEIPQPQLDDVHALLEASGRQVTGHQQAGRFAKFVTTYQDQYGDDQESVFCYFPGAPAQADVEAFARQAAGPHEHVLLSRGELSVKPALGRAFSRSQFIDSLANFSRYRDRLIQEYRESSIPSHYVPLKLRETGDLLDGAIDAWLMSPGRNHLSLLGTFGTGKTWFARRTAARWAQSKAGGRSPVLITIREFAQIEKIEDIVAAAFTNSLKVPLRAGFSTFKRLNDEGRLALIFDGFDEFDRRADYADAVRKFEQIAKLAGPASKVLLTCREEFFRDDRETRDAHDRIRIGDRPNYEILYLAPFDDAQIREALFKLDPTKASETFLRIQALESLQDLAHRPVLLDMLARTLPQLTDAAEINLARLYQEYTGAEMARRDYDYSLPPADRLAFAKDLAWEMQHRQRSIPFSEFPSRVMEKFGLQNDPAKAARFESDLRTQCYLQRDAAGNYEFAHLSMREYFVALRVEKLLRGEPGEWPTALTDAIVSFLPDLLADYPYIVERSSDGRMVKVPAGPFIFGMQSENNLSFKVLEQPFWIDRHPVTNAEYCAFLNECQAKDVGAWIELENKDWSRIVTKKSVFEVVPSWEDHPVTMVSWHGASAFAKWAGKTLPIAEQWEKAARGVDGRLYPFGKWDPSRANTPEKGPRATTAVLTYEGRGDSPYGCLDMAGNVWEWMENWFDEAEDAKELRGGSWDYHQGGARSSAHTKSQPAYRIINFGFRCAKADSHAS